MRPHAPATRRRPDGPAPRPGPARPPRPNFPTFFVARYFAVRPDQLPAAAASILAAGAVAAAIRFLVVRARPELALHRALVGLRLTVATVLRCLEDAVSSGPSGRGIR